MTKMTQTKMTQTYREYYVRTSRPKPAMHPRPNNTNGSILSNLALRMTATYVVVFGVLSWLCYLLAGRKAMMIVDAIQQTTAIRTITTHELVQWRLDRLDDILADMRTDHHTNKTLTRLNDWAQLKIGLLESDETDASSATFETRGNFILASCGPFDNTNLQYDIGRELHRADMYYRFNRTNGCYLSEDNIRKLNTAVAVCLQAIILTPEQLYDRVTLHKATLAEKEQFAIYEQALINYVPYVISTPVDSDAETMANMFEGLREKSLKMEIDGLHIFNLTVGRDGWLAWGTHRPVDYKPADNVAAFASDNNWHIKKHYALFKPGKEQNPIAVGDAEINANPRLARTFCPEVVNTHRELLGLIKK